MKSYVGKTVCRYNIKNGKFFIHEGVVTEGGRRLYVCFKDGTAKHICPKRGEFGKIFTSGPTLWLLERDDELAKRTFIEYEEQTSIELQKQIDRKRELIEMLKEEGKLI